MAMTNVTSPRWQPGQLLFVGLPGHTVSPDVAALVRAGRVGGVVLFGRNVRDPAQVRALVAELHDLAPPDAPLVVGLDQEGGRVQRLRAPWTEWPPMRVLGEGLPEETGRVARALAVELRDAGFDLDFAPVVDVDSNPDNPVIGDRSFASTPERVAAHARAFVEAMQAEGVAACAKHFPGHGDTDLDSHLALPRLDLDAARLREVELPPFRAAIEAGVASVMTAHVLFARLDDKRPATLSPDVMAILRHELGFEGVVFSDDIEMRALADHWSARTCSIGALEAGVDSILVCSKPELRDEVLAHLEAAPDALLEAPLERVRALKDRFAGGRGAGAAGPPYQAHLALAASIGGETVVARAPGVDPTERA